MAKGREKLVRAKERAKEREKKKGKGWQTG